jgi:hypothetical protein
LIIFLKLLKGWGGTERADHDAHPASDATLVMNEDQAFRLAIEGLGGAGIQTRGILAMAALDGKPVIGIRVLNPHPGQGRGGLVNRLGKASIQGAPVHGTGNLAALAGDTTFRIDKNRFHYSPQNARL